MKDPKKLFNTRLDSNTVRAIDFREGDPINEAALQALIRDAIGLNTAKKETCSKPEKYTLSAWEGSRRP